MENELKNLSAKYNFRLAPPAPTGLIEKTHSVLELPKSLQHLYSITNGLRCGWFRIPPIYDPDRVKQTWESIQRVNDPATSKYLADENDFLKRYLIFLLRRFHELKN